MPIYEFSCRDCRKEFETLVRASDTPECPTCHSVQLEKKLSVFAAVGSGADTSASFGPCGSCGHPDGPGACSVN